MLNESLTYEKIQAFAKAGVHELSDDELDVISGYGSWNGYDRNGCGEIAKNIDGLGSVFKQLLGF